MASGLGEYMTGGLQSLKIGVVTVFGILAPGLWFCSTAFLYLNFLFGYTTLQSINETTDGLISLVGPYLASIFGFLIVYVVGSVLRILSPDGPDRFSPIPKEDDSPIKRNDRFPYRNLPEYLESRELKEIAKLVPWYVDDTEKHEKKRSKTFIHFIKLYIGHKNPVMANHLAKQEAFIRLLSGVFYAVLFSSFVFLSTFFQYKSLNTQLFKVCLSVFLFNLFILIGILKAFHYQRLRELVMILSAYFIIGPGNKSPYNSSGNK